MIVRPPLNWWRMLFVWDGSVLPAILPQLLLVLCVSVFALHFDGRVFGIKVPLDTAPFPMVGASLALFLAFRNNASYDRFVDARRHWGAILIASRNLVSQARCAGVGDLPAHARRLAAFAHALRHQLRGSDALPELARYLDPVDLAVVARAEVRPPLVLQCVRTGLGALAPAQMWMLDRELCALSAAAGSCERIAGTPIPYPHGVLLHRTMYAYCFLLPFGLVDTIGAATPLMSVLLAYTLFALEEIAQQVGDPFGAAPNALALDALSRGVERAVLELCGQPLPDPVAPDKNFVVT
jgi:ion channel-forming bestrophin family protein